MKNNRSLFPPLFGEIPTGGGGGGSGNKIQLAELPEASLQYKDRIVQYIGATTEALTNGYFYKCVEHTTTEGGTITVTYSWDNVKVQPSIVRFHAVETVVADGVKTYRELLNSFVTTLDYTKHVYLGYKTSSELEYMLSLSRHTTGLTFSAISTYWTGSKIDAKTIVANIDNDTLSNCQMYENGSIGDNVAAVGIEFTLYESEV